MTLRDLVRKVFRDVREGSGGEVSVNCPFCIEIAGKPDTKQRLGLNTTTGVGHCYRCEKKHTSKGGRQYWFRELCRVFHQNYSIDLEEKDAEDAASATQEKKVVPTKLPSEYEPLWKNVDDHIGKIALRYLLNRRVSLEQIKKHRIGFCAVGRYAYRIIIPVYSPRGRLTAFVARDFSGNNKYKYLNSDGAKALFNVPLKKKEEALLGEGVFDAMSGERALKAVDSIAGLGKTLTKAQVKTLSKYKRVTIWPDPDRAGVEGSIKRAIALQKRKVEVFIVLPDEDVDTDTDLGNMKSLEVLMRYREAIPYTSGVAALMRVRIAHVAPPKKKRTFVKKSTAPQNVS